MSDKGVTVQVYRIVIKATAQAIWDAITKPEWTERYAYGGRVAIGHVTKLAAVPPARLLEVGRMLAAAGVALTVLPSTETCIPSPVSRHLIVYHTFGLSGVAFAVTVLLESGFSLHEEDERSDLTLATYGKAFETDEVVRVVPDYDASTTARNALGVLRLAVGIECPGDLHGEGEIPLDGLDDSRRVELVDVGIQIVPGTGHFDR